MLHECRLAIVMTFSASCFLSAAQMDQHIPVHRGHMLHLHSLKWRWRVYNFYGIFILTERDRISTKKSSFVGTLY